MAVENSVCLITSFKLNCESLIKSSLSTCGIGINSTGSIPIILNTACSHLIVVLKSLSTSSSIKESVFSNFLIISEKSFAFKTTPPGFTIIASTSVLIDSSVSVASKTTLLSAAVISIDSKITLEVLVDIAFITMLKAFTNCAF